MAGSDFVDLVSGVVRRASGRHQGAVLQLAFTPDGRTAASAGRDNRILLWDVERRTIRETLVGHSERITGLAVSPDGRTLYSSGLDGKIMLWDLSGERRLGRPFALPDGAVGQALSPDGRTVAVAHSDGTVTVVELGTLRTRSLRVSHEALAGVAFLRDGRLLATVPRAAGSPSGYGVEVDLASGRIGPRHAELGSPQAPSVDAGGRRMALVRRGAALVQPLAAGRPAGRRALLPAPRRNAERGAQRRRPQPRRHDPRGHRDRRRRPDADPLVPDRVRHDRGAAAVLARRARAGGRQPRGLGALLVDPDVEAAISQARRPPRLRALALDQPGRTHAGLGRHGRHTPPLRHRDPPAARRAAARRRRTARRPPSSRSTARTCSRSPPPEAASAGTSAPRRGCSGHAPSRAARSPARSGTTSFRPATTPRPAPAKSLRPRRSRDQALPHAQPSASGGTIRRNDAASNSATTRRSLAIRREAVHCRAHSVRHMKVLQVWTRILSSRNEPLPRRSRCSLCLHSATTRSTTVRPAEVATTVISWPWRRPSRSVPPSGDGGRWCPNA